MNPYPARFIIEKERIFAENSNKPHGHGLINITDFIPYTKNPMIAGFFRQVGISEALGSGFRKLAKYGKIYFGTEPKIYEEDVFRIEISTVKDSIPQVTEQVTEQATEQVEREAKILEFCKTGRSTKELMDFLGLKHREHFRAEILNPMIERGLLLLSIPDKPNSPKQQYYSVKEIK